MDKYREFLADQILTEDKVITYRYLSRALRVHVNTAKQMLYDFHKSQNARKPGSLHATYLVYGTKKVEELSQQAGGDGDVEMTSSMPEVEPAGEEVPVLVLSLVAEEQLNDVLGQYESVKSIHVYSVGPQPVKDLQMLSDPARQVLELSTGDSPAELSKVYGTIANSRAHRRERKGPMPVPVASRLPAKPDVKVAPAKEATSPPTKEEKKDTPLSTATAKKPTPSLARAGSSGIMQAFAKGKAATQKKKQDSQKQESQPATPSGAEEDSSMALSDDGEDESQPLPKPEADDSGKTGRKSRKEREEELRRMMDDDEDDDEEEKDADTPMEEAEEELVDEEEQVASPEPVKEEPAEVIAASTGDGRRRGRRRVMRKKQIMDDQGYLVTIQEPGWESFSEDEAPPASKPKSTASSTASQAPKQKKAANKSGQGSIMSFFSKK